MPKGNRASACPGAGPQAEVPTRVAESVRHDALMYTVRSDVGKFPEESALLHFHVAHQLNMGVLSWNRNCW